LPDGIFLNKKPNLSKFWRIFQLKMLVYFVAVRSIYVTATCDCSWHFW
jgi:hypothetical protein